MTDRDATLVDDRATVPELFACRRCRHLRSVRHMTCDAFPDGIAWLVLSGQHRHRTPLPGDHGVQFAPLPRDDATP